MCTVTFIPKKNSDFIFTTSRDESPDRESMPPAKYSKNGHDHYYPKDKIAGGSWIATSTKKQLLCVLNGAFKAHERKTDYRKSRGLILVDLLYSENMAQEVRFIDLEGIEPFTMIILDWTVGLRGYEMIWDGKEKHFGFLNDQPRMWSSSSLYSTEMKEKRLGWFKEFINSEEINAESIWNFHLEGGEQNEEFGYVMDRGFVKTTSITQIVKNLDQVDMKFRNLQTSEEKELSFKTTERVDG